jgi:hypothetical protein
MVFKFPASGIQLLRVSLITLFYLVVIGVAYEREPKAIWHWVVASLLVMPILLSACYATFVAGLDLVVDDVGICRICDGRKFKRMEWSDIEAIKDIVLAGAYGRRRRFFNVLTKSSSKRRFWGSRKIVFSDEMDNFPAFVRVINEKLRLHDIEVRRLRGGELRSCHEISIQGD